MTDYVYELHGHTMVKVRVSNKGDITRVESAKGTPAHNKYNKGEFKPLQKDKKKNM